MKKLLKHFNGYKKECVLGPLFKLLEASFELLVPLVVAQIIDTAIPSSDKSYLIKMCLLLVGLALVGFTCAVVAQFFAAKAACGFTKKLKSTLFSHLQTLSHTELDELGSSTLITRMTSDTNQIQTGINLTIRLALRSPFVVFGAMILALIVDTRGGLIFAVAIPVLAVVVFAILLGCIPLYKKLQSKLDGVLKRTRENLQGARVVKAFNLQESEREQFLLESNALNRLQKFVGRFSALLNPLTFVIINIAIILLINSGAIRVEAGLISQGAVFALYNYMSQILVELIKFANLIVTLTKSLASAKRVAKVLEMENSLISGEKVYGNLEECGVEFREVALKYKNAQSDAIDNISFSAKKGEVVGIIGGTGAGKSTLVNLIPRFYDATKGQVLVDGVDVKEYDVKALREKIGIVPQKSVLFKGSIKDNLKWKNPNATDEELYNALEVSQALEVVNSKDGGLDAVVEQNGANFSGGQRQRLAIARALVGNPEILILDDSSSALDYATDLKLRKALKSVAKEKTLFIVSQRIASIKDADKIVVLDDGKLLGLGTHDELIDTCEEYRQTYQAQTGKEV